MSSLIIKIISIARSFTIRSENLWLFIRYFLKWKEIVFLPAHVDIEPNNNCNLKCRHCQISHLSRKTTYLNGKCFKRILDQMPGLLGIKLQGSGEPLLNKEFLDMLRLGEQYKIHMSFVSNGSLCDYGAARQLVQLKNTSIIFSIDGASKETFENIRAGSSFEEIKKNIKNLIKIRGAKRFPRIFIWTVVTKKNFKEISQIVKLAKELGAGHITLQLFLSSFGKQEVEKYVNEIAIDRNSKEVTDKLEEAKKTAEAMDVSFSVVGNELYTRDKKCPWPWRGAFIDSCGNVVPCCMLSDANIENMGNVFDKDFAKIWYSKKYRDLRNKIRSHHLPDYCKHCYADAV